MGPWAVCDYRAIWLWEHKFLALQQAMEVPVMGISLICEFSDAAIGSLPCPVASNLSEISYAFPVCDDQYAGFPMGQSTRAGLVTFNDEALSRRCEASPTITCHNTHIVGSHPPPTVGTALFVSSGG